MESGGARGPAARRVVARATSRPARTPAPTTPVPPTTTARPRARKADRSSPSWTPRSATPTRATTRAPRARTCPTAYGYEGDDDDCKYHVVWSSTPICEEPGNVLFTLKATDKVDGDRRGAPSPEVFTTTPGDWDAPGYCDDESMLAGTGGPFVEGPPGTYVGPVGFPATGQWSVRFHFFPNCAHWVNSPHGHVSFHVRVP